MDREALSALLERVAAGVVSPDEALLAFRMRPFEELGYAKPDHHRAVRQGASEVIYGAGKTREQIASIAVSLLEGGQERVLVTRIDADTADFLRGRFAFAYSEVGRLGVAGSPSAKDGVGRVLVLTGGTSDLPVAEEAAVTAEFLGSRVVRVYDVGVAGLHRLLAQTEEIMTANAIVVAAGMEGALASVVGGLADCPVIGVPTSVGYGASFGGVAALLSMINSCAAGVSVVNIDNGFGGGYLADRINRLACRAERQEGAK